MDEIQLKLILESISNEMIRIKDFNFTENQIKSKWFGNKPATINDIEITEKRLDIDLPEDYKELIQITNGFHAFNAVEPTFLELNKIDFLKNINPNLISIWKQTDDSEIKNIGILLEKSIIIAGINEEQSFLLIPPDKTYENWRYWKWANWNPGEESYDSLKSYLEEVLDFMKNEL